MILQLFKPLFCFFLALIIAACSANKPTNSSSDYKLTSTLMPSPTCRSSDGFMFWEYADHISVYSYDHNKTDITIPESFYNKPVTPIENHAFRDIGDNRSINIVSINFPKTLTSIGDFAFAGCRGLTGIILPNTVESIEFEAFSGCSGIKSINLPEKLTSIGARAFEDCTGLTGTLELPETLISIGSDAFHGCSNLTSIKFSKTLTSIGANAFDNCRGLTGLSFPETLTSIENSAFAGCQNIKIVRLYSPPHAVTTIWGSNSSLAIEVPLKHIDAYKNKAGWKEYAIQITTLEK